MYTKGVSQTNHNEHFLQPQQAKSKESVLDHP